MDRESRDKLAVMITNQRVAALGTLREGGPLVSMVLYVVTKDFCNFYIHASRLAQHTQDFLADPRISLMIAEPDCNAEDPQLLARVSIRGMIAEIPKTGSDYEAVKAMYLTRYPDSVVTFQLGDFGLYSIQPEKARYVAGFGKAFNLTLDDFKQTALKA